MEYVIGIGELMVSNEQDAVIKTYALSSCVAVTMYSSLKKAAGMVHIALPAACNWTNASHEKLGYYATTGLPHLLHRLNQAYGCTESELEIKLYGGADSVRQEDTFKIGQKNLEMVQSILKDKGLRYQLVDVGGFLMRSIELQVATGVVKVNSQRSNI